MMGFWCFYGPGWPKEHHGLLWFPHIQSVVPVVGLVVVVVVVVVVGIPVQYHLLPKYLQPLLALVSCYPGILVFFWYSGVMVCFCLLLLPSASASVSKSMLLYPSSAADSCQVRTMIRLQEGWSGGRGGGGGKGGPVVQVARMEHSEGTRAVMAFWKDGKCCVWCDGDC